MSVEALPLPLCPLCTSPMAVHEERAVDAAGETCGTVYCGGCEGLWPLLSGIAVLVPEPGSYLASYRESVLASLAERGLACAANLEIIAEFCEGHVADPMRFGDDWTESELTGRAVGVPDVEQRSGFDESEGGRAYLRLMEAYQEEGPVPSLLRCLSADASTVAEIGVGAGRLSIELASRVDELYLVDSSLRSVLVARERCAGKKARVRGVVAQAEAFELRADSIDALVAANLVDLMEDPAALVAAAGRCLVERGQLLLCTPDPSLGSGEEDALVELVGALDFELVERRAAVPWLRYHGPRYSQLYFVELIAAERG